MLAYGAISPFNNISSAMLTSLCPDSSIPIPFLQSIPYTISAFITPFIGATVDAYGKRQAWMVVSGVLASCTNKQANKQAKKWLKLFKNK